MMCVCGLALCVFELLEYLSLACSVAEVYASVCVPAAGTGEPGDVSGDEVGCESEVVADSDVAVLSSAGSWDYGGSWGGAPQDNTLAFRVAFVDVVCYCIAWPFWSW